MRLLPVTSRYRAHLVMAAAAILGIVGVAAVLYLYSSHRRITDRQVLLEAVAEWQRAGEPGSGPPEGILGQQAGQGYYDDAIATAHLYKDPHEQRQNTAQIAMMRAENGDAAGAVEMVKPFSGSETANWTMAYIALAQAGNGDLAGALKTGASLMSPDELQVEYARGQISRGDLEGALQTTEHIPPHEATQLFYGIGSVLRLRNEPKRVDELAAHISDHQQTAQFREIVQLALRPPEYRPFPLSPCEKAGEMAMNGRFAEADALVEQNKCRSVSFVAGKQYAVDPAGAERLLRRNATDETLVSGLEQMATTAAEKGDIHEALRFLDEIQKLQIQESGLVQEIARLWTVKAGPKQVLTWARSRPTLDQRASALLGVAEALGHARPSVDNSLFTRNM